MKGPTGRTQPEAEEWGSRSPEGTNGSPAWPTSRRRHQGQGVRRRRPKGSSFLARALREPEAARASLPLPLRTRRGLRRRSGRRWRDSRRGRQLAVPLFEDRRCALGTKPQVLRLDLLLHLAMSKAADRVRHHRGARVHRGEVLHASPIGAPLRSALVGLDELADTSGKLLQRGTGRGVELIVDAREPKAPDQSLHLDGGPLLRPDVVLLEELTQPQHRVGVVAAPVLEEFLAARRSIVIRAPAVAERVGLDLTADLSPLLEPRFVIVVHDPEGATVLALKLLLIGRCSGARFRLSLVEALAEVLDGSVADGGVSELRTGQTWAFAELLKTPETIVGDAHGLRHLAATDSHRCAVGPLREGIVSQGERARQKVHRLAEVAVQGVDDDSNMIVPGKQHVGGRGRNAVILVSG